MLILVSVGVNITTDGNIIGASEKTVNLTNNKIGEEQNRVNELMNEFSNI